MLARIARRMVPLRGQSAMTATTTMKFCQSASLGGVSATMASLLPFVPSPETGKRAGGIIIPTAKGRPIAQNYSTGSRNARYSVMLSSPSLSSTALPRFGVNSVGVGHNSPARQARGCAAVGASLNQIRYVWQEVIRQVPSDDPNRVGKLTFEDVDLADTRMARAIRAEAPLRRRPNFVRHEKKWMRRKRMKMERRYLRLQEGVEELKAYIKFKQDNKPEY